MNKKDLEKTKAFLKYLAEVLEEVFDVKTDIIPFNAKDFISKSDYGFKVLCHFEKENKECPFTEMIVEFIILEIKRKGEKDVRHFGIHYNPCKTNFIENENLEKYPSKITGVKAVKETGYLPEFNGTFSFDFLDYVWRFINYSLSRFSKTIEKHYSPGCDFKDYKPDEIDVFDKCYKKCIEKLVEERIKKQAREEFGVDL